MQIYRVPRRIPRFWSLKLSILTIFALFIISNITGLSISRAYAPAIENLHAAEKMAEYIPADIPSSGDDNLDSIIFRAGMRHGVDPRLIHHVIWQESRYKVEAKSHKGAQGLMQMIPATARRFDCQDVNDPESNVEAGTKYLRWLLKRFEGDTTLALAAYNAGEGSVDKHAGVPPFDETQKYVRNIIARYGKTFHPVLTPEEAKFAFQLVKGNAQQ